ncbi:MAG: hypothetical protein L0229_09220, partial [Blastocatellia bacterium]|nr:hypothetical protein [Blastocatellia bacterium]
YNREDLLDIIGRESMIPLDQLKESSMYQLIAEEGLKEGLKEGAAETLRLMIAKRFPELDVRDEISRISDPSVLQRLCVEMIDMPDAASLQKQLTAILKS